MKKFRLINKFENEVILNKTDIAHIEKVLRIKDNDLIVCFDFDKEYICQVATKPLFKLTVVSSKILEKIEPFPINVYLGVIKKQNMELAIRMLNELNVFSITPVFYERTQSRIDLNKVRINTIIENSCKQSGRVEPIIVKESITFKKLITTPITGINLAASLDVTNNKIDFNHLNNNEYNLFIGPEGGFSEFENNWLASNCLKIKINNIILKTETASCSMVSMLISKIIQTE